MKMPWPSGSVWRKLKADLNQKKANDKHLAMNAMLMVVEELKATWGGGEKTRGEENTFLATFISPLRELLPTSGLHQLKGWTK